MLGQLATDSTGLLAAQVKRHVLVAAESGTELSLLGLVDDRQHASDRLADDADLRELRGGTTDDLGHAELETQSQDSVSFTCTSSTASLVPQASVYLSELLLVVIQLGEKFRLLLLAEFVSLDRLDYTQSPVLSVSQSPSPIYRLLCCAALLAACSFRGVAAHAPMAPVLSPNCRPDSTSTVVSNCAHSRAADLCIRGGRRGKDPPIRRKRRQHSRAFMAQEAYPSFSFLVGVKLPFWLLRGLQKRLRKTGWLATTTGTSCATFAPPWPQPAPP